MLRNLTLLFLILSTELSVGQTVLSETHNDATIGIDRKAWNGIGNTSLHSDGYAHDFTLPPRTNPCQEITGIRVEINLTGYTNNGSCNHNEIYYNLFYGCNTYAGGASCLPATNLIAEPFFPPNTSPPPFNFGNPLGSPLNSGIEPDFGENLSVDIIPVTFPGDCFAVTNGHISYEYTITVTVTVTDTAPTTPTFTQVAGICTGEALSALPSTSNEGITGTWSPSLDNTTTTTYTFTPDADQCATSQTMTIAVTPTVTPTFATVSPICSGDTLTPLPTMSNEGITGTWSPVLDNTSTTTYTFIPDAGQCGLNQTMTITVNPLVTPTFTQVADICSGDTLTPLPTTSNEGITGTWSPVLDNTSTTTYTFTPDAGQCILTQTMTITVNPLITPTFTQVSPICSGDALPPLPTTSNEGITGTWSPALDNTATATYTFTPDVGQCGLNQTMTITVNPSELPVFTQVPPICNGDILNTLPNISNNGVTGTWSPALNNTATTTYTFTPDPGFCPTTVSMTITVNDNPIVILQSEYFLCFNTGGDVAIPLSIDTGLTTGTFNFTWFLEGVITPGANQENYAPTQAGNYEVQVQNSMTLCETQVATTVTALFEPAFEANVISDAFQDNQMIEVTATSSGIFEYNLDNGQWQDSPIFTNVSIGEHVVFVRDIRGCIENSQNVVVIGYPKYFTPNDDGFHDTWNITAPGNPNDFIASSDIYIFDRYGKLLKQLNPKGDGWNGSFKGLKMPSNDYWFIVNYTEPNSGVRKQFKSHFTLKR
jgi:gliding motility-associated-like protein